MRRDSEQQQTTILAQHKAILVVENRNEKLLLRAVRLTKANERVRLWTQRLPKDTVIY